MSKAPVTEPFGRRAARLTSPQGLLALELDERKGEIFEQIDGLAAFLVCRALRREAAVIVKRSSNGNHLSFKGLNPIQTRLITDIYSVQQLHSRGNGSFPKKLQ
jgi:hypothetical protein